jgi:hypothetical protein
MLVLRNQFPFLEGHTYTLYEANRRSTERGNMLNGDLTENPTYLPTCCSVFAKAYIESVKKSVYFIQYFAHPESMRHEDNVGKEVMTEGKEIVGTSEERANESFLTKKLIFI